MEDSELVDSVLLQFLAFLSHSMLHILLKYFVSMFP
jgi:hypothetical protein